MRGILLALCLFVGVAVSHPGYPEGTADLLWPERAAPELILELTLLDVSDLVPAETEPAETPSPVGDADDEALPVARVCQPCTA